MANTVIQIKRSSSTATPTNGSLAAAEPAYSFNSNKLFLGNTNGTGVIEVGGKYWVDTAQSAYDISVLAFDKANAANVLAYNTGIGANAYAQAIGVASNAYAETLAAGANGWANTISSTRAAASNAYAETLAAGANGWANTVGTDAKNYANNTFLKLTAPSQTITGNLAITGSLTIAGNTYSVDAENLRVSDPLIYLAGNNYVSDIVDIGFIGNYVNATGSNVHTGLYREHADKMWYLFQGYDAEPINNHLGALSNNMVLAVLNADIRTNNLWLGGANATLTIGAAFDKANAANVLAYNTGIGANAYAQAIGASSNAYAVTLAAGANGWANTISSTRAAASNAYAETLAAGANGWANTISSTRAAASNAYAETIGAAANTNAANASYLSTGTVPSARISGAYTGITGVGTLTQGTWNANVITVPYGGTGVNTFTQNGILYGNTAGALKVTSAGTEGQVLQASSTGVPSFGMLDGGTF